MIIPTQLEKLDELLSGGFRPSSLVTVGGRPGMGKTAFLLTCANNLIEYGHKFLFFSLESTAVNITNKLLFQKAEVEFSKIPETRSMEGIHITGIEYQRLISASNLHKNLNSCISTERDFEKIRDIILWLNDETKVVFIDFLQLMIHGKRYEDTSKIMVELKALAHEKNICIVISSQLSRNLEQKQGKRPLLIDYRDSGVIEETADQSIMIFRREYYDPYDKPGRGELIVNKNRFGYCGEANVTFRKEIMKFENFTPISFENFSRETASVFGDFNPN